jgi:WD40 repeat protein
LQLIDSWTLPLLGRVTTMTFNDTGDRLIMGDAAGMLSLWDVETGMLLDQRGGVHDAPIDVLVRVPNHNRVLTSANDGYIVVMDIVDDRLQEVAYEEVGQAGTPMQVAGIAVHPNSEMLIATMTNSATFMYLLDEAGTLIAAPEDYSLTAMPAAVQADYGMNGQTIHVVWWDTIRVYETNTMSERYRFELPERLFWLRPLQSARNGQRMLLVNPRRMVAVWDFDSRQYLPLVTVTEASNFDMQAALHPDGHLVAVIDNPQQVTLWRIAPNSEGTLQATQIAVNRPEIRRPAQTDIPDALATITVDNLPHLTELYSFGDGYLTQALWSPDGSYLVVVGTNLLRIYNRDLRLLRELPLSDTDVTHAAFNADGLMLATANSQGDVHLWEANTGRSLALLTEVHDQPITTLAFVSDSKIVVRDSGGDIAVLHYDGRSLQDYNRTSALTSYQIFDWHASGANVRFVVGTINRPQISSTQVIQILDMDASGTFVESATGVQGHVAIFGRDGQTVIVHNGEQLEIYDSRDMAFLQSIHLPITAQAIDHLQLDGTGNRVLLSDYNQGLFIFNLNDQSLQPIENSRALMTAPASTVALHPTADRLAVITSRNRIAVWQLQESRSDNLEATTIASDMPVMGRIQTFVTASNHLAAATTDDGGLLLFDMITGNLLRRVDLQTWGLENQDVRFAPDGTVLVVMGQTANGQHTQVNFVDVQAAIQGGEAVMRGNHPYLFRREYLSGFDFAPDGSTLITGGRQVRLWGMGTSPYVRDDTLDLRGLTIFAYHPNGQEVATIRPGNTLRVLQTSNMHERYSLRIAGRTLPPSIFLTYTPDGEQIIMAVNGENPRLFDSATGQEVRALQHEDENYTFHDMLLSPDGNLLLMVQDSGVFFWDLQSDNDMATRLPFDIAVRQIAISADGKRLLLVGLDGMVHVLGIADD